MAFDLVARLRLKDEMSKGIQKATKSAEQMAEATRKASDMTKSMTGSTERLTNALGRNISGLNHAQVEAGQWLDKSGRIRDANGKWAMTTERATGSTQRNTSALAQNRGALVQANLSALTLLKTVGQLALAYGGLTGTMKIFKATIGGAANMEMSQISLRAMFGENEAAADDFFNFLNNKAKESIFAQNDFFTSGKMMTAVFKEDKKNLEYAVNLTERLGASNPLQGMEGGAYALREALSGDMVSLRDRFNMSKAQTQRIKEATTEAEKLVELDKILTEMGFGTDYIAKVADTGIARWDKVKDTIGIGLAEAGKKGLDKLKPQLDNLAKFLESDSGTALFEAIGNGVYNVINAFISMGEWIYKNRDGIASVFEFIGNALQPFIDGIKTAAPYVKEFFQYLIDNQDTILPIVHGILALVGTYALVDKGVNSFTNLAGGIKNVFSVIKAGKFGTLLNPWSLAITGIIAAVFLIIKNWDKIKPAVQKVIDAVTPYVEKFIDFMQKLWNKVKEFVDFARPYVQKFVDKLGELWTKVEEGIKWVADLWNKFTEGAKKTEFIQTLVDGFKEFTSTVGGALEEVGKFFGGFFAIFSGNEDGGSKMLKAVGFSQESIDNLIYVVDILKKVIGGWLVIVYTTFKAYFSLIWQYLQLAWNTIKIIVITALVLIWNTLKVIFTAAWNFIKIIWNVIVGVIRVAWTLITNIIKMAWNIIITIIQTAINVVKGIIDFFIAVFTGNWSAAWDAIWGILKSVWNGILEFLGNVFGGLISTFVETFESIWTSIGDILDSIFNYFTEVINSVVEAGKNTWSQLTDLLTKPVEKAKDILEGIVDTLFGWFDDIIGLAGKVLEKIGVVKTEKKKNLDDDDSDGSHRFGRANIPYDGYRATLHKNERVLTAQENKDYTLGRNRGQGSTFQFGDIIIQGASGNVEQMADDLMKVMARRLKEAGDLGSF